MRRSWKFESEFGKNESSITGTIFLFMLATAILALSECAAAQVGPYPGTGTCPSGQAVTHIDRRSPARCTPFASEPPDCHGASEKLLYNASTKTWSCVAEISLGTTGNRVVASIDFGCRNGEGNCGQNDEEAPLTDTVTAPWATTSSKLNCFAQLGSTDHPYESSDDVWVEKVSARGVPLTGAVEVSAWAWNFTWGTWFIACEEVL